MATVVSIVGSFLLNRRLVGQLGVDAPSVPPSTVGGSPSVCGGPTCGDGHVCGSGSGTQFGAITVLAAQTKSVGGVPSAQDFGVVTRISGGVTSSAAGVPSAQAFGTSTIKTSTTVPVGGVGSAQAFGSVGVVYQQFVKPGGVPSAQAFGVAGLLAYHVWLHELDCQDAELAELNPGELDLDPLACLVPVLSSICGGPICGDGSLCGGDAGYHLTPLVEHDSPLTPTTTRSFDLQPAGCS